MVPSVGFVGVLGLGFGLLSSPRQYPGGGEPRVRGSRSRTAQCVQGAGEPSLQLGQWVGGKRAGTARSLVSRAYGNTSQGREGCGAEREARVPSNEYRKARGACLLSDNLRNWPKVQRPCHALSS